MKVLSFFILIFSLYSVTACAQQKKVEPLSSLPEVITNPDNYNPLEAEEASVIIRKGTEYPRSGAFHDFKGKGTYICKQCNLSLFHSEDKFDSGTGWPSFDDAIAGNVEELTDADGRRTEIVCSNCKGHLGHVFKGEGFTEKQTRHCANSISLNFVEEKGRKDKK